MTTEGDASGQRTADAPASHAPSGPKKGRPGEAPPAEGRGAGSAARPPSLRRERARPAAPAASRHCRATRKPAGAGAPEVRHREPGGGPWRPRAKAHFRLAAAVPRVGKETRPSGRKDGGGVRLSLNRLLMGAAGAWAGPSLRTRVPRALQVRAVGTVPEPVPQAPRGRDITQDGGRRQRCALGGLVCSVISGV